MPYKENIRNSKIHLSNKSTSIILTLYSKVQILNWLQFMKCKRYVGIAALGNVQFSRDFKNMSEWKFLKVYMFIWANAGYEMRGDLD